jgi:Cu2+-exporting ATPase
MTVCYHCGETIPNGVNIIASLNSIDKPMCCIGCKAVAEFIIDNESQEFYQYRQDKYPHKSITQANDNWQHLDQKSVFESLTESTNKDLVLVSIKIEDMYCSACSWLLNKQFNKQAGINEVRINSMNHLMQIEFNPKIIKLSKIFNLIQQLGYKAVPQKLSEKNQNTEKNNYIKKIAVAGFGMMFIMTLSVPLYSENIGYIQAPIKRFLTIVSLIIATMVYFYAGRDFLKNAIRDLKNKHLGMDVPIALSISLTYIVSVISTFNRSSHIYFDSMSMFVFFLLIGRFIESQLKHKGMNVKESLSALIPVSVNRKIESNRYEVVPLSEVKKGDHLKVLNNDTIPCDGRVISGQCSVNESILTGESRGIKKDIGQIILAGSVITNGEIIFESITTNDNTFLAKLTDLMELAQSKKPEYLQKVDSIASYFIATVLFLAVLTFSWHWMHSPDKIMLAVISILIATCPCALSLATPSALSAASINLLKHGILTNNTGAITQLDAIKHWFFDKTGTLTESELSIDKIHEFSPYDGYLNIANAMQNNSNHPISSAFRHDDSIFFEKIQLINGQGIIANKKDQIWQMGSKKWFTSMDISIPEIKLSNNNTLVYLACNNILITAFELSNHIRNGSKELIQSLHNENVSLQILSGDSQSAVHNSASKLSIKKYKAELKAEEKIVAISEVQNLNEKCVMVGDGVNDAPVLSQADVSFSLKQGTYLAHSASDFIILGSSLKSIIHARKVSEKTNVIIKQNLIWSIFYNASIIPIAFMGLLEPWIAACGMSLSSLLVVLNSRRLL